MTPTFVVAAAAIASAIVIAGSAGPTALAADPTDAQVAEAVQFRETFGLRSGEEYVRRSFGDGSFSSSDWNVPLTDDEVADLARRTEVRDSLPPAIGYLLEQPDQAGFFTDQLDHGLPVFLFTGDVADHRRAIERLLPGGTPFDVRRVDRSRERLDEIQAAIERDMDLLLKQGVDVISVGPHIAGNAVEVGVREHVKHARDVLAQYGEGIVVQVDAPAVMDACTGITNCPRAKAGLAIQANGDTHVCTSGWLGRRWDDAPPHQLVMITAGHCIKYHTNWDGDRGWHLLNGTCIGDAAARYAPKPWVDGANADVGLIPIVDSSCIPETKNYLLLSDDSEVLGRITSERVADPHGNPNITNLQAEGDSLCRIGWGSYDKNRTNPYCGSLWRTNKTKETCSPGLTSCVTVKHMQVASFDSSPGDSGGTMFYPNASSGNKRLYGSHSHSDDNDEPPPAASGGQRRGWYSSQDWQIWTLEHHNSGSGAYGIVVSPCFDSNC